MEKEHEIAITGGPLKPHEYVLVNAEMTAGDEVWIQNHASKYGKDQEMLLCLGDVQLATAQRLITGWSLSKTVTRPNGVKETTPFHYAQENVANLPIAIYRYVLKRIDEIYPEDGAPEAFLPGAADSSEASLKKEKESQPKD